MAKIDTLFMSKTAEKPYPLGPHIPIWPISGRTPPPREFSTDLESPKLIIWSYSVYSRTLIDRFDQARFVKKKQ